MKIDNDTSTLFVKQDLFANPSAKKASNATGEELDNALIADINTIDMNRWGDSYNVQLDPNSKHVSVGGMITQFGYIDDRSPEYQNLSIDWKGDYNQFLLTPEDAAAEMETFIGSALNRTNSDSYAWDMKCFAQNLNSYMKFQTDSYDPDQDAYLNGLTKRFDLLDPDHQDTRINQMRSMITTAQSGDVIHVDTENFSEQIEKSFAQSPAADFSNQAANNNNKNNTFDKYKLNNQQILAYKISMTLAQNDASLMSKLLYKGNDQHFTTAAEAMKSYQNDESNTSATEMSDKKRHLKNTPPNETAHAEAKQANIVNEVQNTSEEQGASKFRITAADWQQVSKNYAAENKDELSAIYGIYNS